MELRPRRHNRHRQPSGRDYSSPRETRLYGRRPEALTNADSTAASRLILVEGHRASFKSAAEGATPFSINLLAAICRKA